MWSIMIMEQEFLNFIEARDLECLLEAIRKQYVRIGKFSGTIEVILKTKKQKENLGVLMNKDYYYAENIIKVSMKKLIDQLNQTKFKNIDLLCVLQMYYGNEITTKQQVKQVVLLENHKVHIELEVLYKDTIIGHWLFNSDSALYLKIIKIAKDDIESLKLTLNSLINLPFLKNEQQSLSVFATIMTKDPHYFDQGINLLLLIKFLKFHFKIESDLTSIQKNELLLQAGLLKESILNDCTIFNIKAIDLKKQSHQALEYFFNLKQSFNIHLDNILQIEKFYGVKSILIIENPSVFQYLLEQIKFQKIQDIALICTHGELNFAAYQIIDKLNFSDIKLFYAGDFDPEGILIAQRLKQRYKNEISFVCYEKKYYLKAISNKKISNVRLQKLHKCIEKEFFEIKQLLLQYQLCGYQEALIDDYLKILKKLNNSY